MLDGGKKWNNGKERARSTHLLDEEMDRLPSVSS
jgi:hypothetical protein